MKKRQIEENGEKIVAGYGQVDITPPTGEFGSFRLAPNKRSLGVHDPLYVHAVYLTNAKNALFMISVDTGMVSELIVERIKAGITEKTGASASQILVASTHAHNAAETFGEEPFVDTTVQVDRVVDASVQAADTAFKEKFPARIGWGHLELPGFAKNRFQNGQGGDVGLVDDRLDFLKIEDEAGNYKGIVWHLAAHPTTCMRAGFLTSADFYGVANQRTVETLGGFSTFFNGACGNINPELGERTFERAAYYGKQIADQLAETVPQTKTVSEGCLASTQTCIEIPLTEKRKEMVLPDDRDEIMAYFKEIETREIAFTEEAYEENWELYQRLRCSWWRHKLVEDFGDVDSESVCIQAHRILDHLMVTTPGEMFVEFQLDLQKAFPDNRAMIFGYANGYCGYVPNAKSFDADSYETNPTLMHRAGLYAGEKMIEKGIERLREL